MSNATYSLSGEVRNTFNHNGVDRVKVIAKGGKGLNQFERSTYTDRTGYYQMAIPRLNDVIINVNAEKQNHLFTPKQFTTVDSVQAYTASFNDTTRAFAPGRQTALAEVTDLLVSADEARQEVVLRLNLSNKNYTGVELKRGARVLTNIRKGESLSYVDTTGTPGFSYIYSVRTYWLENGQTRYSKAITQVVDFPQVQAVTSFVATADDSLSVVNLEWAHPNERLDEYRILRNGALLANVPVGQFRYSDETGLPGKRYRYSIQAVSQANSREVLSAEKVARADFPYMPMVPVVEATAMPDSNMLMLEWEYTVARTEGYLVMRNDVIMDTVLHSEGQYHYSVVDRFGKPGVMNQYAITPYFHLGERFVKAVPRTVNAIFPALLTPSNFTANEKNGEDLISLLWQYPTHNIDGFIIYRDNVEMASIAKSQYFFDDETGLPSTEYTYTIRAYSTREGQLYTSKTDEETATFPKVAAPKGLWASQYASMVHVLVNWQHNGWLQTFAEERGYELEVAPWPVNPDLRVDDNRRPGPTSTSWTLLANSLAATERYYVHANPVLQHNVNYPSDIGAYRYRLRAYRKIGGVKYYSTYVYNNDEGLTLESKEGQYTPQNLTATQGTKSNLVTITWEDNIHNSNVLNAYKIYRKGYDASSFELIGSVAENVEVFNDDKGISGKKYIYEVRPDLSSSASFAQYQRGAAVVGWSRGAGSISGSVVTDENASPVTGATIQAQAVIAKELYTYTTTTDENGRYRLENIYYPNETEYAVTVDFLDHEFREKTQTARFTSSIQHVNLDPFIDLNSFVVEGRVVHYNSSCGVDSVKIRVISTFNDGSTGETAGYSDKEGHYSIVYNPRANNLRTIEIKADTFTVMHTRPQSQDTVFHQFAEDYLRISNPSAAPTVTTFNLEEQTAVPVNFSLRTTCGAIPGNSRYTLNIQSDNGCYNAVLQTNQQGALSLNLPPLNYNVTVVGAKPVNQLNYPYVEYFSSISKNLDLRLFGEQDTVQSDFVYHKVAKISASGLNDYCGNDAANPAIITKGETYVMQFEATENINGQCHVSDGFMVVDNSAMATYQNRYDTLYLNEAGRFEPYTFVPDNPNPSAPFRRTIRVEYHTEDLGFQSELILPVIVQGVSEIDGKDIIVNPTEGGDVQMPLFVLRDPPGDGSYSYIEEGTTYTQEIAFNREITSTFKPNFSFDKTWMGQWGIELEFEGTYESQWGRNYSYEVTSEVTKRLQTSDDSEELNKDASAYLQGEIADVIVGAGLVSRYGLSWNIQVLDEPDCKVQKESIVATGVGDISTTWIYTVDHIEGLIDEYESIISRINEGTFSVEGETPEASLAKYTAYRDNWKQVLRYHQRETKPHVALCDKLNYQKLPSPWQQYLTAGDENPFNISDPWLFTDAIIEVPLQQRENVVKLAVHGFCENVGYYENNEFVENEDFTWTEEAISDYNAIHSMITDWGSNSSQFLKLLDDFDYDSDGNDVGWSTEYNWRFAPQARNITFAGATEYEESLSATKTKTRTKMKANTYGFEIGAKAVISYDLDIAGTKILETETKFGADYGLEWAYEDDISNTVEESNEIGYVLADDDPGDQFSVTVINGVHANHTPYFALVGGRSSCPAEPGTINRDQYTMELGDSLGNSYSPTQRFLDPDEPAVFPLKITNNSPFGEGRWYALYLNTNSNRKGARVRVYGNEVGAYSVDFFLQPGQTEYFNLYVYRAPGEFAHEDILPDLQVDCDEYFSHRLVHLKAYWLHPCTDVNIISDEQHTINRNPDGNEGYLAVLGGYDVENENLKRVDMQYRRKGSNNWITWKMLPRDSLVDYYERYRTAPPRPPRYPVFWDISGQPNIVDGEYELRAQYICERAGTLQSNVVHITVDRSSFMLHGQPAPTDGVLSLGEEVYATYNKAIDAAQLQPQHYRLWYEENGQQSLTSTAQVVGNRILFPLSDSLRKALDGKTLHVAIDSLQDLQGNQQLAAVSWQFVLRYNPVFWQPGEIALSAFSGTKARSAAWLQYSKSENVLNYHLSFSEGNWIEADQANGQIPLTGKNLWLEMDARGLAKGVYHDTVWANIPGFGQLPLPVTFHVLHKAPPWHVDPAQFEHSVHVLANYQLNQQMATSTDTMDMIAAFIGSELRGMSRILQTGARYAAYVPIYGNADDKGKAVHFRVWRAADGRMYDACLPHQDTIKFDPAVSLHGSFLSPRLLQINTQRDVVRMVPLQKGWNWLSLNVESQSLQRALRAVKLQDGDVLKTLNTSAEYTDRFGNGGQWVSANGLSQFQPEKGYLLHLSQADTLLLSGDTATTSSITLQTGWNLIGQPRQQARPLASGLAFNPAPANNTVLKSQNAVSVYGSGTWNGSLQQMKPFEAYMLQAGQPGRISYKTTPRPEEWEVDASAFEYNMTLTARLKFGGEPSLDTHDIVGAYIDGELRGVGKLQWLPQIRKYRVVLFVYHHDVQAEEVVFKLYDSDREMLFNAHETVAFVANQRLGQLSDPYILSDVTETGIAVKQWADNGLAVYPNPVNDAFTVVFQNAAGGPYQLEVRDMMGRLLYGQAIEATVGLNQVTLQTAKLGLSKGMYQVHVQNAQSRSSVMICKP